MRLLKVGLLITDFRPMSKRRNAESMLESDLALGGGQGKLLSDAGLALAVLIESACVHCLNVCWIQFKALVTLLPVYK